jgi:hypothetical protein
MENIGYNLRLAWTRTTQVRTGTQGSLQEAIRYTLGRPTRLLLTSPRCSTPISTLLQPSSPTSLLAPGRPALAEYDATVHGEMTCAWPLPTVDGGARRRGQWWEDGWIATRAAFEGLPARESFREGIHGISVIHRGITNGRKTWTNGTPSSTQTSDCPSGSPVLHDPLQDCVLHR